MLVVRSLLQVGQSAKVSGSRPVGLCALGAA